VRGRIEEKSIFGRGRKRETVGIEKNILGDGHIERENYGSGYHARDSEH
jgi:hypothetical protein